MDFLRAQLDEMMGKDRNKLPNERPQQTIRFTDPRVCKYFICGFCPNDLFVNTKSDIGACTSIHDEDAKEEWSKCKDKARYGYEKQFLLRLEDIVSDLEKKMRKHNQRIEGQGDPSPLSKEATDRLDVIQEKMVSLFKEATRLGEEGKVEESQQIISTIDNLKKEKEALTSGRSLTQQEKRMKVCETCGAFLVIGDTDKRISSHLEGKQHQGFQLVRDTIEQLKAKLEGGADNRSRSPSERAGRGRRDSYSPRGKEERERDGRDSRDRERERDRDRDRYYHRDRYEDRDRRDYGRDRDRGRDERRGERVKEYYEDPYDDRGYRPHKRGNYPDDDRSYRPKSK